MHRPRRWLLLLLVASLPAITVTGVILSNQSSGPRSVSTGSTNSTTTRPSPASTARSTPTNPSNTTPPTTKPPAPTTPEPSTDSSTPLQQGSSGPAVRALQERLVSLGFWLGAADGRFGTSTLHAVVAFQKAQGLPRDGVAGPVTLRAVSLASRPVPRSTRGHLIEIDLSRQILIVATDGRATWVMDTSTGISRGSTPKGEFRVFRQVNGYDSGPLGVLYRPKYFSNGVAIHGYPMVPAGPASHGCVRVTNVAMDWLWSQDAVPIGTTVWVY